ncbi:PTS transporter subunit EIIA [Lacticaseibacillus sharpeae]|uniref:PTS EIIA type-2 domain-containing protein n=1 Tax=Lacticaseibacillus sharpeae JCM 1186 = DSM 20505 TaxID=1291052 RepID=A0A0R1ZUV5_9LACO|nr:PTS transporter subunit EIIA [Lacticaseibacillus sharpeae]KRM54556.1 hypothetical protein FC18_GL000366 [Lacticaseibacillus sharpeae JCM 1186 = DSM 20505]
MLSLFKKYATTNVELNNYNELDAIKELARIAAKKSNQDEQLVKSGLLASVAQGAATVDGRVLTTTATITEAHHIHIVAVTFAKNINWNGSDIDFAFVILTPDGTDESQVAKVADLIHQQLAGKELAVLKSDTGALDKLIKTVKNEIAA